MMLVNCRGEMVAKRQLLVKDSPCPNIPIQPKTKTKKDLKMNGCWPTASHIQDQG
jgi:hypothetical protein